MRIIFRYTTKRRLVFCFFLMILTASMNAFTSFLFSTIIQFATQGSGSYLLLLLGAIVVYSLFFLLNYVEIRVINQLMFEFNTRIKEGFFQSLLQDQKGKIPTGEALNFVTNDLKLVEQNYLGSFFQIVKLLATFVISFVTAIFYDPRMALVFILFSLISLFIPKFFAQKIKHSSKEWSSANAKFVSAFKEMVSGLPVIRMFHSQNYFFTKNATLIEQVEQRLQKMNCLTQVSSSLINTVGTICFFIPIIIGGILVSEQQLDLANLMGLVQISNTIVNPLISGIALISTFHSVQPIIEKLQAYLTAIPTSSVEKPAPLATGLINFQNLTISRNGEPLFQPITTTIAAGEKVLLRGRSGIGKSTLLQLILNPAVSHQGTIEIARQKWTTNGKSDFLLVPQEPFLLNASIKENICFDETFSSQKYQAVLAQTDLTALAQEWGDKPIGENGQFLSGGQKQRVVLARTLIREPQILLLDEYTSALDSAATQKIQTIVQALPQTVLEVAHKITPEEELQYDKIIELTD